MTITIADRMSAVQASPTMALNAKAKTMAQAGQDIINLTVGEPDFDTPDPIKKAAIQAIQDGATKYTAPDGILPLKYAIIKKLKEDHGLNYEPQEIIASCGAKHSLYNIAMAVLNPGDEAVIPCPYWVSYPAMVALAGGQSVMIETDYDNSFKITPSKLEAAMTDKTRLVFLNSPSNPTGMVYSREELQKLAKVLSAYPKAIIICDDIYEYLTFGEHEFTHLLTVAPELKDRTVIVNGVSKSYAMTGWRLGYAAGPKELILAMKKLQSHSTSNPCSITQHAAIEAMTLGKAGIADMLTTFEERLSSAHEALTSIPGVRALPAQGAFYLFPEVHGLIEQLGVADDIALCELILEKAQVALVPGTAFGSPGHCRISCAVDKKRVNEALSRIRALL